MEISDIEWLDSRDACHAWKPAADGRRTAWCGLTVPVTDIDTIGDYTKCGPCSIKVGQHIAELDPTVASREPEIASGVGYTSTGDEAT